MTTTIIQFCWLTMCVYQEARGERFSDQVRVAQVVINRSIERNKSYSEVIFEPNQFSWTKNFDPTSKHAIRDFNAFIQCANAAHFAIERMISGDRSEGINHFYNYNEVDPKWAKEMEVIKKSVNFVFLKG